MMPQGDAVLQVPSQTSGGGRGGKILFILFLLSLAVVALVVLMAVPLGTEDTPEDVLDEYTDALNEQDVKRMFDQTVLRFADDYLERLDELATSVFYLDPHVTIISSKAVYQDGMNDFQLFYGQTIAEEVEDAFAVVVDDFCILEYEYTLEYQDAGQEQTFTVEMVCVNIYGNWYLVNPGYLAMD